MNDTQSSHPKVLNTHRKNCGSDYDVPKERIFGAGEMSKYATRCPNCGFGSALPFKEVEAIFGDLKV